MKENKNHFNGDSFVVQLADDSLEEAGEENDERVSNHSFHQQSESEGGESEERSNQIEFNGHADQESSNQFQFNGHQLHSNGQQNERSDQIQFNGQQHFHQLHSNEQQLHSLQSSSSYSLPNPESLISSVTCKPPNLHIPRVQNESTGYIPDHPNIPAAQYVEMQINRQRASAHQIVLSRPLKDYAGKPPTQSLFRLSDFELCNTLGTGTFGRVYLAKYRGASSSSATNAAGKCSSLASSLETATSSSTVGSATFLAVKVMKKREIIRLAQLEHIYCEKHLLSHLKNPFIIRLYATFQDEMNLFMLMEYAIGGELFTYLRRAERFSFPTAQFYVAEIVVALEYLHSFDIVYRDLKPENLLLDHQGHIKITDFGFSKVLYGSKTWTLCGTPEYLAPEIILGKGHDKAVDWWALGILCFEMLAGYPPFYEQTNYVIYEKILQGIYHFPGHIPAVAKDFVRKLLLADVSKRLGNLSNGAGDVKAHPFFEGIDWKALERRQSTPPIIPTWGHPGDTGNFEKYPEEAVDYSAALERDPYQALFQYF